MSNRHSFQFSKAALSAALVFLLTPLASIAAGGMDDPRLLMEKAELLMARATGAQAQGSAVASRNAQALSAAECTAIEASARDAAAAYVDRGQPVSPGSVIQNSTCFMDILGIKIPVSMTGIGWLDGVISTVASKAMTSACSAGMSYMNDLRSSAVNQIRSGATGALQINQLNIGGVNVGSSVNSATSQATNSLISNASNAASATSTSGLFGSSSGSGLFGTQTSGTTQGY